jgi:hypothetical protein
LCWSAGPERTTYDIAVTDEDLTVLATAINLADPEYRVDPGLLSDLAPGEWILWRVTTRLPDGSRNRSPTFTAVIE